jgi:Secretion system C-terminal sorting domain/SprB repeat
MKFFKLIFLIYAGAFFVTSSVFGQVANPTVQIIGLGTTNPTNSAEVPIGATLDLLITVGNTGTASITANRVRPRISVPTIVEILPDAQQTLPSGWSIVSSTTQAINICNGTDIIPVNGNRSIIIKVRGVSSGSAGSSVQLFFGGTGSCTATGPAQNSNVNDDAGSLTLTVVAGCNLGLTTSVGTILCNGGTTNIIATPINATGVVEYSITGGVPFQTSNIFNVNAGGSPYTITAREVANPFSCIVTATVTVTEPIALLAPVVNIVQPTCTNANAIVTISTVTTGLVFSVDNGAFIPYPTGGFLLTTGIHTVQSRNSNNCTSPLTTFTISAQPITPPAPTVGTITQPNCTVSTGNVILNGLPTGNWVINPGTIAGNTANFTVGTLAAGDYNFTVTNSIGCTSVLSGNVLINNVVGAPIAPSINVVQPTCSISTGTLTINSATTGLIFSLDGGAFAAYPIGGYTGITSGNHSLIAQNISGCLSPFANFVINMEPTAPSVPTVNVLQPSCTVATGTIFITSTTSGITFSFDGGPFLSYPVGGFTTTAGTHSIAAQNSNGCAPSVINNIIVNPQPTSPSVSVSASAITCFGGNSTLTVVTSGGVLPYQYSLNGGAFQASNLFTVSAGIFSITVKDVNGCTGSNNTTVTQPTAIIASLSSGSIACNGGNTLLTVQATGGTGAFEYSLNNGAFQTSNTFNVVAGVYTASVRLLANQLCTATTTALTVVQPNVLKTTALALPISYCGGTTVVKVEATGGRLPYTGIGNFIKGPGKWNYTITDANGCIATTQVLILPPGCVDLKVFPNPAQDFITVNHSEALAEAFIQILGINGALILSKAVPQNTFITNLDINRLASGTYLLVYVNEGKRKEIKFIKNNTK